jgi:hypothetical protein
MAVDCKSTGITVQVRFLSSLFLLPVINKKDRLFFYFIIIIFLLAPLFCWLIYMNFYHINEYQIMLTVYFFYSLICISFSLFLSTCKIDWKTVFTIMLYIFLIFMLLWGLMILTPVYLSSEIQTNSIFFGENIFFCETMFIRYTTFELCAACIISFWPIIFLIFEYCINSDNVWAVFFCYSFIILCYSCFCLGIVYFNWIVPIYFSPASLFLYCNTFWLNVGWIIIKIFGHYPTFIWWFLFIFIFIFLFFCLLWIIICLLPSVPHRFLSMYDIIFCVFLPYICIFLFCIGALLI